MSGKFYLKILKIFIWKKNKEKRHIAKIFKLIARLPKMNEIGKRQNIVLNKKSAFIGTLFFFIFFKFIL